jgi:aspartate racemase
MEQLKTLGMLGGLSWHSTVSYYRHINQRVESELGGYRSAPLLLSSLDFGPIVEYQLAREWDKAADVLAARACELESIGAQAVVICSNTMHKVAARVSGSLSIPLLHIATAIGGELKKRGQRKVTLLGTRYTMKEPFLYEALKEEGIEASPPTPQQAKAINEAIFKRLVHGQVTEQDQSLLNSIVRDSLASSSECVILGCTEIAMLVNPETSEHVLDTTVVHADMAADVVLGQSA